MGRIHTSPREESISEEEPPETEKNGIIFMHNGVLA